MTEEDLLYAYEQLQRGHTLSLRYISALNRMLHHLRLHRSSHPNTSSAAASASAVVCLPPLRSLLDSEEWFYCPEVDISCPLAAENHLYHHSTESHLLKLKPNQFGLELSALQQQHTGRGRGRGGGREEFVPLQSQLNEFFDSFRFQNSSRSAGANTSVDLSNKLPPKLIHLHAASASAAVASLFPNGLAGDQRSVSRSRTSYRTKKPPTRSTLPEDSPLLVPTESYAQQKVSKRTLADIDKEFVTSLRTAPPLAAGSGSQSSSPLRRRQQRQQHQRQESSISNAQPFPEHLRRHLRGATAEGGAGSYHRRTPSPIASAQGARSDSSLNLLRRRNSGNGNSLSKERKMPLPVEFSASGGASVSGNLIFAPTESRLRQLNQDKHRLEEELTVEQEKGWKNLLRSYDQMSDGSSLRAKPFRPSSGGSVGFAGASSEHSSRPRSRSSRHQGRSLLTPPAAAESRGSLADMFLSEVRGIDMKSFLMKLDHATVSSPAAASSPVERQANRSKSQSDDQEEEEREEEEERQSLSRSRSDSDDLSESLPLHSLSLFQSLLKRNALSTSAPASAVAPGVDIETPRRSVPNPSAPLRQPEAEATAAPEMASQRISQHGIPLSLPLRGATLSPISSSSSPVSSPSSAEKDSSSSILFPALSLHGDRDKAGDRIGNGDGDDLFEFSLEEQEQDRDLRGLDRGSGLGLGLSEVLSAAALAGGVTGDRNQHSIGERPLNLQRRLRQRESQSNKETTTTVSVPIIVPSAESPPAAGGEAEAAAQSSSQRLDPNGAPIPTLSPLSRQSSSYSFNSVEGKRPLLERRTSSPSPDPAPLEQLQQEQEQQQELPVTRVNRSSLDSQDREEEEEEKDEVPSPSALPSAADSPLSDDQPQPQSSPSVSPSGKRIPILRKQLSLTPNDLRTLLVRGFEVVKVPPPLPSLPHPPLCLQHGVSGYPKPKVVAYDPSSQEIIWRSSKKDRFSFMRSSSSLLEKTLPLRDITEVRKGIQTDVLMKGGLLDPGRCVSLVTAYRTLDLVFGSQRDRELFVRSLIVLLDEQKQQQEVSGGSGTVPDVIFR
jgi:ribosomal protein L12E/L44/L45/RPP1/RPP2